MLLPFSPSHTFPLSLRTQRPDGLVAVVALNRALDGLSRTFSIEGIGAGSCRIDLSVEGHSVASILVDPNSVKC